MVSPVMRAELHYQRRSAIPVRHTILRRLGTVVLVAGLIIALSLVVLELWSALARTDLTALLGGQDALQLLLLNILPLLLLPLTFVFHFSLLLRALMFSTGSIRRERLGATWQLLQLTDQSPARIILAKWIATVWHLAPHYLLLSVLRVGVIIFVGLELFRFDNFYIDRNSVQFFFAVKPLPFRVQPEMFVISAALVVLLTFANLLFTSALGVFVSVARRSGYSGDQVAIAFVLRTVLLVFPALWLISHAQQSSYYPATTANTLGLSLLDNGTLSAAAVLSAPRHQLNFVIGGSYSQFFPPDTLAYLLGYYVVLILLGLGAAFWSARKETT